MATISRLPVSRRVAIEELAQCDHAFLREDWAVYVAGLFNVAAPIVVRTVNSTEFKGLNYAEDDNGNPLADGTSIRGCDAADLAETIACTHGFHPYQQGRGSRLRTACVFLLEHMLPEGYPEAIARAMRAEVGEQDPRANALMSAHEAADNAAQALAQTLDDVWTDLPKSVREILSEDRNFWLEKCNQWKAASHAFLSPAPEGSK